MSGSPGTGSKDVPWWYNERADLSVLAGAIWKSGNVAFEEFVDEKRKISRRTGKLSRKYTGRVDLHFSVRGKTFIAEAKQCWSGAAAPNHNTPNKIAKFLKKACDDIRRSKPHNQRRLGIVFAIPYIRAQHVKHIDDRVKKWISAIRDVDCDAMAWIFPAVARRAKHGTSYFPGIAIFIREI